VLLWTDRSRRLALALAAALLTVLVVLPLAVVVVAAVAARWNSVLPEAFTAAHLRDALAGDQLASLSVSIQTALLAGALAVLVGAVAALAARSLSPRGRRAVDAVFHLPVAVPSVVVGLGLLVAFSRPPLLLNGTRTIVVVAQAVLVLSFTYSTVSAALVRMDPVLELAAASLGAGPARVLWRIRLPLLLPAVGAATGLSVALCMGELGATVMVYPAQWRTLPVTVFGLSDRGDVFLACADTVVLLGATFLLLVLIGSAVSGRRRRGAPSRARSVRAARLPVPR
jgi:2-aminoethylphosphonate transport system permease protein